MNSVGLFCLWTMLYLWVYPMKLIAWLRLCQTVAHFLNQIQFSIIRNLQNQTQQCIIFIIIFQISLNSHLQIVSSDISFPSFQAIISQQELSFEKSGNQLQQSVIGYNLTFISMQNQENFDPNTLNQIYNSMIFADNQEDLCQTFHLSHRCPQNDQASELPQRNDIFSNPFDHLAAESFCTVERGSLQIVPERPDMDVNTKLQQGLVSTIKSIESSFIFHEQENQEENERKLIIKTEELTLRSSETQIRDDIFNEYSPKKHRSLLKNLKPKVHIIKQPKQLIKELKREYKYNDSITADVFLSLNDTIIKLKVAKILPIVSQKGRLSGLIIKEGDKEYKIKVSNSKIETFDPSLQLWNESAQTWEQFTFKVKIRNT